MKFSAKELSFVAAMTALFIGAQYVLSFSYGIEIVTVLLLTFSYVFGVRSGMLSATAFSLLRCFVFGFFPNVLILYLVYYNAFAFVCGACGKLRRDSLKRIATAAVFSLIALFCAYFIFFPLPISPLKKNFISALLWILFFLSVAALAASAIFGFAGKNKTVELFFMTAVGCISTVFFTLIDDVITPLFYGYSSGAAYAYFVGGFLAMLPQTVCAFATVSALFLPLVKIFRKFRKSVVKKENLCYYEDEK